MRHNKLGHTGLFVSELCLGTMTFGGTGEIWSQIGSLQQADAEALVGRAFDAGINFLDTANVYSEGVSEEITGAALRNLKIPRDQVVIATKAYGRMSPGPNGGGSSRLHLIDACKASLKRLATDHIDLYQLHGFDPATPIEESLGALATLVQHGHVRYIGVSNWAAWQIVKSLGISAARNLPRFESLQAYYTIAGRDLERELVPALISENLGLLVWSPLAGGFLSGKFTRDQETAPEGRRATFDFPPVNRDRAFDCIEAMQPMAAERQVSVARIAIAWLLHQKVVTSVIIGAKKPEQLADNIAAADVELTAAELDTLDKVSALAPEYPGWMFARQSVRGELLAGVGRKNAR